MRLDEERVRRETEEGLRAFRQRQRGDAEDDQASPPPPPQSGKGEGDEAGEADEWGVGRKRKRSARERDIKGLRRKIAGCEEGKGERVSSASKAAAAAAHETSPDGETVGGRSNEKEKTKEEAKEKAKEKATDKAKEDKALSALVDYGSDDSD